MKTRLFSILVAAAVAASALLVLAGAGSARTAGAQTLRFVSVTRYQSPGVPNVGGTLIFNDVMYNRAPQFGKPAGARIGTAEGVCTLVSETKAQCVITAHVPDGQLVVVGAIVATDKPQPDHYGIAGGAGAYGSARGTVTSTPLGPTRSLIVVHLAS